MTRNRCNIQRVSTLKLPVFLLALLMTGTALGLEQPEYEVLYQDGNIEYRLYEPYIVAETRVDDARSYGSASNEGFMRLFRYISGDNTSRSEIAMTAPVQRSRSSEEIAMTAPVQRNAVDGGWRVAFMLPGKYSLDTAPVPTDNRVSLREIPPRLMAVIRYSGRWTQRNLDKFDARLREHIEQAGIETLGPSESAAYNAPFTLPFLRRNEVMIEVAGYPLGASASSDD